MGIYEDLEAIGADNRVEVPDEQLAAIEPKALAPILFGMSLAFPQAGDGVARRHDITERLAELRDEYRLQGMRDDWSLQAAKTIREAVNVVYMNGGMARGASFHDQYEREKAKAPLYYDNPYATLTPRESTSDVVDAGPESVTAQFREDFEKIHTVEEAKASVLSFYRAMADMKQRYGHKVSLPDYSSGQMAGDYLLKLAQQSSGDFSSSEIIGRVRSAGKAFCDELDKKLDHPLNQRFGLVYAKARGGTDPDLDMARAYSQEVERQKEALEDITDIKAKMDAETKGLHINSAKYKKMRECVDEICAMKEHYDPDDLDQVRKMSAALKKMNEAATDYYTDKVEGKEKKTSRGIERKNTALFLMNITDPKAKDKLKGLKDFRMKKGEGKTQRSFSELMEEEKGANMARTGRRKREPKQNQASVTPTK